MHRTFDIIYRIWLVVAVICIIANLYMFIFMGHWLISLVAAIFLAVTIWWNERL